MAREERKREEEIKTAGKEVIGEFRSRAAGKNALVLDCLRLEITRVLNEDGGGGEIFLSAEGRESITSSYVMPTASLRGGMAFSLYGVIFKTLAGDVLPRTDQW